MASSISSEWIGQLADRNLKQSNNPIMNNGTLETLQTDRSTNSTRAARPAVNAGELAGLKRELLQAEMRLAKARATIASADVDGNGFTAQLKAFTK